MVMLEDFTKHYFIKAFTEKCALLAYWQSLIPGHSEHKKILIIAHKDPKALCADIANSEERLAALQLSNAKATPLFYKRARQLASAEGALLILDFLNESEINSIAINNTQPELIAFKKENYYLGISHKLEIALNEEINTLKEQLTHAL